MAQKKNPAGRHARKPTRATPGSIGGDLIGHRVLARGKDSGAFAGILVRRDGQAVELAECRRLWYWDGAASLSELSAKGVSKPQNCKFPAPVRREFIFDLIEMIPEEAAASKSIAEVPVWTAH